MLGTLLAMGGLELGLRVASALLRPHPPVIEGKGPDSEIRIVCIGESTTAAQWPFTPWPHTAENDLRRQHPELSIRVINRGLVGIRTGEILERLPKWLEDDHPQIAITMLGINDEGNILAYPRNDIRPQLIENSKALKLLALLWRTTWGVGAPSAAGCDAPRRSETLNGISDRSRP